MSTKASKSGDSAEATGTSTTTEADTVDQSSDDTNVTISTGDTFTRNVDIDWSPWTKHFPWDDEAEAK